MTEESSSTLEEDWLVFDVQRDNWISMKGQQNEANEKRLDPYRPVTLLHSSERDLADKKRESKE